MARKKKHEEHGAGERWAVPYADFLSLLLALFIALFAISTIDKKKLASFVEAISAAFSFKPISSSAPPSIIEGVGVKQKREDAKKKIKERVEQIIKKLNLEGKVSVEVIPMGVRIRILDYILFPPCSTEINQEYKELLNGIAEVIKEAKLPVEVEGHTDDIPPGPTCIYPSNWELSASRAAAVVRYLITAGNLPPYLFSAVGYADTKPISPNNSELGRKLNRRIEINLITGTDKEAELKEKADFIYKENSEEKNEKQKTTTESKR
ncbi:OmpA/MotB family protein [Sulfurihydrogenibium yellowstonense]|jgi:chemotaxis protein MotB|uniref:Chemotaxis protein MotB n=1 Tax=Sulfurihydrogenibium yellowstonense SS-5 TaxID=432331 RepID=C4FKK0_9AQUI|nr:flagellar motor protein MotB [Sulfurihydrogenibium yellowstonense]EEP60398.1 chemotaxis protein MotB [Sulfurihydrogenibium yellowstonense SS-5]